MSGLSYDDWAAALAGFFFDEAHDGEEILFGVDDASLAEASGLEEAKAARSLCQAVRDVVMDHWGLGIIRRRMQRWRRQGAPGAHPALPFLALTVLAASRMGEHATIASHNYYVPLRRLLNPEDDETGAPGSFTDHIELLWRDLARWANEDLEGRRGRLVIRDPGHHRYVGLAIQHALVKSADLRRLDAFFRRIGLEPGEEVAPAELRRALAVWTAGRTETWARRLERISTDPDLTGYCEGLLEREARRWDGRPRDPRTGRAFGRIRLGIASARRPVLAMYAQWDELLPQALTVVSPAGSLELSRWEGWYDPRPLPVEVRDALSEGLELRGEQWRFAFQADDAYALAYDDDLGAWISVDTMSYGDKYVLLVRDEVATEALGFLREAASTDARVHQTAPRFLPNGWQLVVDVRIDVRPQASTPTVLGSLIPAGAGPRLRLLGGLPVGPARGVYLRGGEPALALSTVASQEHAVLIRRVSDGHVERLSIAEAANREVPLWQLRLEPDRYEISHGESAVTLQIIDGIAEAAGPGVGTIAHPGAGDTMVVGTVVSPSDVRRRPITLPAPRDTRTSFLLGAAPSQYHVVKPPTWPAEYFEYFPTGGQVDAWPDFEAAWHIVPDGDSGFEARLVAAIEPQPSPGAQGSPWARLITRSKLTDGHDEDARHLWQRYQAAASSGDV